MRERFPFGGLFEFTAERRHGRSAEDDTNALEVLGETVDRAGLGVLKRAPNLRDPHRGVVEEDRHHLRGKAAA